MLTSAFWARRLPKICEQTLLCPVSKLAREGSQGTASCLVSGLSSPSRHSNGSPGNPSSTPSPRNKRIAGPLKCRRANLLCLLESLGLGGLVQLCAHNSQVGIENLVDARKRELP